MRVLEITHLGNRTDFNAAYSTGLSVFLLDTNEKVINLEKTLFFQQNGCTFIQRAHVLQMWYSKGYSETIKI